MKFIKEEVMSKISWYAARIFITCIIAFIVAFFLGMLLAFMNVGLIIDGHMDDTIIMVVLVVFSIIIGWKVSSPFIEAAIYD